jgi:hypothetical protein
VTFLKPSPPTPKKLLCTLPLQWQWMADLLGSQGSPVLAFLSVGEKNNNTDELVFLNVKLHVAVAYH